MADFVFSLHFRFVDSNNKCSQQERPRLDKQASGARISVITFWPSILETFLYSLINTLLRSRACVSLRYEMRSSRKMTSLNMQNDCQFSS